MPAGDLITKDGQYEWMLTLLNDIGVPGRGIIVTKVEGLFELPDFKVVGDSEMDETHGGFLGTENLSMRDIVIDLSIYADAVANMHDTIDKLKGAFQPGIEDQFVFQKTGWGKRMVKAKSRGIRGFPSDHKFSKGVASGVALLKCADPRLYTLQLNSTDIVIAANGLSKQGVVNNAGNFKGGSPPVLIINGPATNPRIVNVNNGRTLRIDIVINAGSQLIVDMLARTILLDGVDRRDAERDDNQWWFLDPGNTTIQYVRTAPAPANTSTLTVQWRNAWA